MRDPAQTLVVAKCSANPMLNYVRSAFYARISAELRAERVLRAHLRVVEGVEVHDEADDAAGCAQQMPRAARHGGGPRTESWRRWRDVHRRWCFQPEAAFRDSAPLLKMTHAKYTAKAVHG